MDAVEEAASGHPGMPLGMADAAAVLFDGFLKYDPAEPGWPDRDRFVLSAGHGSMLLYALLHLTGYPQMGLEELRRFRRLGSRTPGHPEYGHTPGVETTTGPLGQGLGAGVGMALAERALAAEFGDELVSHRTWVVAGDGCLMEGVGYEAASLAGRQKLARLIVLWDDNRVTIDGPVSLSFAEDVPARFRAMGWRTLEADGHDTASLARAFAEAVRGGEEEGAGPVLVACRTTIGFGAPSKAGKAASHGAPLGAQEVAGVREAIGWPHPPFSVPEEVRALWREAAGRGAEARRAWEGRIVAAGAKGAELTRRLAGELRPEALAALDALREKFLTEAPKRATRQASQDALAALQEPAPELFGGSADLTGSNLTRAPGQEVAGPENGWDGRYVFFGVREHAMAAALNGIALHGGLRPYGGTFLVFSDYARPALRLAALRLAALMELPVVHVMTHDSIGLGEDGPTHQPVEHLASLRAMPGLVVLRPADAAETAEAWRGRTCPPRWADTSRPLAPRVGGLAARQGIGVARRRRLCAHGGRGRGRGPRGDSACFGLRGRPCTGGGARLPRPRGRCGRRSSRSLRGSSSPAARLPSRRWCSARGRCALRWKRRGGFGWERFAAGAAAFDAAVLPGFGASGRAGRAL